MKFITAILVLIVFTKNTNGQNIIIKDQSFFRNEISSSDTVKSDSWFAIDKGQHFIGSFFSTLLITQVNNRYFNVDKINSKNLAIGITFSFGLAKETIDSQKPNNKFSWKDLMADVAGIATAIAVLEIK
jgi:uncharacterized protein YfiM (DUF2279 family)